MDGKRMALAASALVALVACSTSGGGADGSEGGLGAPQSGPEIPGASQVEGVGLEAIPLPGVRPTVIKTATLRLEVEPGGVQEAVSAATDAAGRQGGFILRSESLQENRATLVLRVPSRRFESALAELRGLGEVEREMVAGEDVGEEFVDLEARLRNLQAEQAVMLRLFDRAASIPDTIRVQNEVSAVQLQIEQIRGRLRFLRDQTSFGTITLNIVERGAEEGVGVIERSWNQALDGLVAIAGGVIAAIGYLVPITVLALAGFFVVRLFTRRVLPRLDVRSP
jgi:Domain of unknown function (DUF4349)